MKATLHFVTGAPGSGKSTALHHILRRRSPYLAFDIDWLAAAASHLAQSDIASGHTTWPAYNALWFEVLHAVHHNHKHAILFSPLDLPDVAAHGQPAWCERIEWLLLDCDDSTRRTRLAARAGWTAAMIEAAITDAHALRPQIAERIDTARTAPDDVATAILSWVDRTK